MPESQQDSAWSWLVLFCVLCCQIVLGGICLSGGLFFVIFTNAFGTDPVETSWLCSLPVTVWFISSPLGSLLTNRYGCRVCSFIGGILTASGLCLSYLATSSVFLFFSYGFLTGLGLGINYTGCMSALNMYFDRYKVLATGIASTGYNVGLIIFADFIISLENQYSWRGMFLILGGIAFNMCACATAMPPLNIKRCNHISHKSTENSSKPFKKKILNFSVFRKMSFILFCASNLFISVSQGVYILHLPSYSKEVGFSQKEIGTILIVYGITNIVGKVFFSFLGQHPKVNVTVVYALSLTGCGVSMGLTPVFLSKIGMLILAGLVGFFFCVTGALINAVIHKIVGFSRFADGVGMSLPFKATGNLLGGPMAGILLAATGRYDFSFYLAGVSMVLASFLMIQPIAHIKHRENGHRIQNIFTASEKDVSGIRNETVSEIEKPVSEEGLTLLNQLPKSDNENGDGRTILKSEV